MRVERWRHGILLLAALASPRALPAQGPANALGQAIRAYQNLDFETSADLLRRALNQSTLLPEQQAEALGYLGASEFFLGHRDAALSAFRQVLSLDPRNRLDALVFPPEVQRVFEEARRSVSIVQVAVPRQTEIRIGQSSVPLRLFASSYHNIGVAIASPSGSVIHWLYTGPIADSIDLSWDGRNAAGDPLQSGEYRLRITSRSPSGKVLRTLDTPLDLTLRGRDTIPIPPAPDSSLYRPERRRAGVMGGLARGVALGAVVLVLPAIAGVDSVELGAPILVGTAIAAAGAGTLIAYPHGKPVPENIEYNRRIRQEWEQKTAAAREENARRRRDVRLLVRAGEPEIREATDQ